MTDLTTIARPKPADVLAGLRALRDLLADPDHWTRGVVARGLDGVPCDTLSPAAMQWCLIGGVDKVTPRESVELRRWMMLQLGGVIDVEADEGVADFNDDPATAHADVLAAIDRAIAHAEQEVAA